METNMFNFDLFGINGVIPVTASGFGNGASTMHFGDGATTMSLSYDDSNSEISLGDLPKPPTNPK
jgi:hypothetical protein